MLVEEAGASHDLGRHQRRGHHRNEAVGERLVHGHRHEGQLQASTDALEVVEARAGDLRPALRVDRIQPFPDGQVILGLETFGGEVARGGTLVTQDHEVFLATHGDAVDDEVGEQTSQAVSLGVGGARATLGFLHLFGEFLGLGQDRGALFLRGAAHGFGDLLLGGSEVLEGLQGLSALRIGLDDLVDEVGVGSAGSLGGAGGFGVLTQGTHINHGSILCQVAAPCPPPQGREGGGSPDSTGGPFPRRAFAARAPPRASRRYSRRPSPPTCAATRTFYRAWHTPHPSPTRTDARGENRRPHFPDQQVRITE